MKLASFVAEGKDCFGAVVGDGVVTLNGKLPYATLRDALTARDGLATIRQAVQGANPDRKLADVRLLPVIPNPDKILCAGINYRSHAAETGRELPKQPSMFIRLANTLTGHEGEMIRPSVSQQFDFEGELAVVIGRGGRHIPVDRALIRAATVEMVVRLADTTIKTKDLLGLRVGDIITTEKDVRSPLTVDVEGVAKYRARGGSYQSGPRYTMTVPGATGWSRPFTFQSAC